MGAAGKAEAETFASSGTTVGRVSLCPWTQGSPAREQAAGSALESAARAGDILLDLLPASPVVSLVRLPAGPVCLLSQALFGGLHLAPA